eukprot:s845_g9.t1
MDCSTKSRIREIPLVGGRGPKPLRSAAHPRGLPGLPEPAASRVAGDNCCSDFVLAIQHVMHTHGRGAFRENPRNSYHWDDPCEQWLSSQPGWWNWDYDACCLFASRRKRQRIVHNLDTTHQLPKLTCGHIHDPSEWTPYRQVDGSMFFPSKEESEYTAHLCFTIVVACSHWALQRGFAVPRIQRLPPMQVSGDWRPLLQLQSSTFRVDAMAAVASYLGLTAASGAPVRRQVSEVWSPGEPFPANSVYIGHDHFRHRFPCTEWRNPFVEGRDGSSHEVVLRYLDWFPTSDLASKLHELSNMQLLCDCEPNHFCHGDVIVGAYNQSYVSPIKPSKPSRRARRLLLGFMVGLRIPAVVANPVTQASLVCGVRNLFPGVQWDHCEWPLVEDLVNTPTFASFHHWIGQRFPDLDGDFGPQILGRGGVMLQRTGVQDQSGAAARKTSVAPLVPFGLSPDQHFQCALHVHESGSPLDWPGPTDLDVRFAAAQMALGPSAVSSMRDFNLRVFEELGARLQPVSDFIRSQQHPEVRCVNPAVHLALIAVLVLIFAWPDTQFPAQLFAGFPAVGWIPPCGLWDSRPSSFVSLDEVFMNGLADAKNLVFSMKPSPDDGVAVEAGVKDQDSGFCSPDFTWPSLQQANRPFRLIRRFVINQASGKKRVIDDACSGGQSALSSDANVLRFCSAIQPCLHIQALQSELGLPCCAWPDDIASSGEDLPSAYRKIPMEPSHTWACIVASLSPEDECVHLRRYFGMLFGLPLAVTAFNRLPFLLQSILRRVLLVLCSFYFDDLTSQDWSSCATHSQSCVQRLCQILGYPFATEKQQPPGSNNDFLGLVHDLSSLRQDGIIRLWVRERLVDKIEAMMSQAESTQTLSPGHASKLYGCLTFLDQGAFAHVARAGLNHLKERQYTDQRAFTVDLSNSFALIRAILELQPKRVVQVNPFSAPRLIVASDASQDSPRQGQAGMLLVHQQGLRLGTYITINESVFALWDDHPTKIAQLELLAVLQGILTFPSHFRDRKVVWWIDNVASLMSLVKGRSDSHELDFMSQLVHLLLYNLHCHIFWEWIPSASNWADGISREGLSDPWWRKHGFRECYKDQGAKALRRSNNAALLRCYCALENGEKAGERFKVALTMVETKEDALNVYLTGKAALDGIGYSDLMENLWEDHLDDNPETKAQLDGQMQAMKDLSKQVGPKDQGNGEPEDELKFPENLGEALELAKRHQGLTLALLLGVLLYLAIAIYISLCSWNLHGNPIDQSDDIRAWLMPEEDVADVVVIAVQDLVDLGPKTMVGPPDGFADMAHGSIFDDGFQWMILWLWVDGWIKFELSNS